MGRPSYIPAIKNKIHDNKSGRPSYVPTDKNVEYDTQYKIVKKRNQSTAVEKQSISDNTTVAA